jgi:hypothetical protein
MILSLPKVPPPVQFPAMLVIVAPTRAEMPKSLIFATILFGRTAYRNINMFDFDDSCSTIRHPPRPEHCDDLDRPPS